MSVNPAGGECPIGSDITQLHREAAKKHAARQLPVLMTNDATLWLSCYSRYLSVFKVLLLDAIFFLISNKYSLLYLNFAIFLSCLYGSQGYQSSAPAPSWRSPHLPTLAPRSRAGQYQIHLLARP